MQYKGDKNLETLLKTNNCDYSLSEVYNFVSSVIATPTDDVNPNDWTKLITKDEEFSNQLIALKEQLLNSDKKAVPSIKVRIDNLREEMKEQKINGFIIPRSDEYQGEYVSAKAERLKWITGFTGSAGQAVVLEDKAIFLTDGRYTLQAKEQVPNEIFDLRDIGGRTGDKNDLAIWLKENVSAGDKIAYDPWLHNIDAIEKLTTIIKDAGGTLLPIDTNPIDKTWDNQPQNPLSPVVPHPIEYAGKSSVDKRSELATKLKENDCDATALTLPEDIAWLLNIRGGDVPCTPLPLSFAIAHDDGNVDLFIDKRKLSDELNNHLGNDIRIHDIDKFIETLNELGSNNKTVLIDSAKTPIKIYNVLKDSGATITKKQSLCQLPKAVKNPVEQQGTIDAHIRDGVALTRFLHQLSKPTIVKNLTEITAADMLEEFRAEGANFRGLSFDTISGAGSNGAIIHYKASKETDKPLSDGEVYLVDSGGQYLDGTTDVTRTIAVAPVSDEIKDHFTRVLKGHIKVAMQVFNEGTTGAEFDPMSRESLQDAGLNYAHSLGHGVGSYLSVHEGPQGLYPSTKTPLQTGMIVSNEPGYYKDGEYGIRIENLVLIQDARQDTNGSKLMKFKTLTMAPIDINMIKNDLLNEQERKWLNDYHAEVKTNIMTQLEKIDSDAAKWLEKVTSPLPNITMPVNGNHKRPPNSNGKNAM